MGLFEDFPGALGFSSNFSGSVGLQQQALQAQFQSAQTQAQVGVNFPGKVYYLNPGQEFVAGNTTIDSHSHLQTNPLPPRHPHRAKKEV